MYSFGHEQTISADAASIWAVWADVDSYPRWDPREERAKLNGPFQAGSTIDSKQRGNPGGTATLTLVEPNRRWIAESPLPGGKLVIDHLIAPSAHGQTTITKRYDVTGPLSLLFRIWWGPRVTRALPATFTALEHEAQARG